MSAFIIIWVSTIIFAVISIICFIVAFFLEEAKYSVIAGLASAIVSFILLFNINVSEPIIEPLDNEIKIYETGVDVTITSEEPDYFTIYYSLDGTDPKYGNIYEDTIVLSDSTAVCARCKFLWKWSSIQKSSYTINYENDETYNQNITFLLNSANHLLENDILQQIKKFTDDFLNDDEENINNKLESSNDLTSLTQTRTEISDISDEFDSTELTNNSDGEPVTAPNSTPSNVNGGINYDEEYNLMTYINQYRTDMGIGTLTWDYELEQAAQTLATEYATGGSMIGLLYYWSINRQCNGAKNAERAVSDWITGNDYIPSESEMLLNPNFSKIGGALYYLPNGNESGYHYFWIVCFA